MDSIRFWYPAMLGPDDENPVRETGTIRIINIHQEPYEIDISSNGRGFHAVFGSHANGNFLCIPGWGFGCEPGPYSEVAWNLSSMAGHGRLGYSDACAIANALALIEFLLGKDIKD